MLKLLVKKQLFDIFKSFFYDSKKSTSRSKASTAGMIALMVFLFAVIMVGMFGVLAYNLVVIAEIGYTWLYFLIFGGVGILLGVVGSVFNTYSGLYLSKDNDLLLSMPIPVRTIVSSRMIGVYLMGLLYSSAVMIPASVIYFIFVPQSVLSVVGTVFMMLIVSAIDFVLSCLLGWVVAKVATKLKNRSFVTVIIALAFIVLYYVLYFKAADMISDLIANAAVYGDRIKGAAAPLYMFGKIGEGDVLSIVIFTAASAALVALSLFVLSKTFLGIATKSADVSSGRAKEKRIKAKGQFATVLSKEFEHFKSSSTYMLNCSLGTVLLPALGVAMLIKGKDVAPFLKTLFVNIPGGIAVGVCCVIFMLVTMNMITAPSVSLEGRSLWILQSIPVSPTLPLTAKLALHILLTGIPSLVCSVCAALAFDMTALDAAFVIVLPLAFTVVSAAMGLIIGLVKANLNWTREIDPIKQSMSVLLVMLINFAFVIVFGVIFYTVGHNIGYVLYLSISLAILVVLSVLSVLWIVKRGGKRLASL